MQFFLRIVAVGFISLGAFSVQGATASVAKCGFLFDVFSTERSVPLQYSIPGEQRHYLTPEQAQPERLEVSNGAFVFSKTGKPFVTKKTAGQIGARPINEYRASLVISEDFELYGMTSRVAGISHHSTPVAGKPVKFAGEVTTDFAGKPLWFSYRSGHYPHGPYRLKLFLDSLVEEGVDLRQVNVSVPDRSGLRPGRTTVPAEFFRKHVQSKWTGDDVIISYILLSDPEDFRPTDPNRKYEIEEVITDIRALIESNPHLVAQRPTALVVRQFTNWIDHYISINHLGFVRVQANIVIPLRARDGAGSAWESYLLRETMRRHPGI